MRGTRSGRGTAGARPAPPWLGTLAVAAVVVALTGCGPGGSPSIASSGIAGASQHSAAVPAGSPALGGSGTGGPGCPAQGVGGDSVPPLCAVTAPTPAAKGVTLPPAASQSPTPGPGPTVTGISTASGAAGGGDKITISGTGFAGATGVDFGTAAAAFTVDSDTEITATSPPGSGSVAIVVIAPAGPSAGSAPAGLFTYVAGAPSLASPSPPAGSSS
jgi:hypothetical protein